MVRGAFSEHRPARTWWRTILWLHGKPLATRLTAEEKEAQVVQGFHFYAQLYRALAGILVFVAGVLAALCYLFPETVSPYCVAATGLGAGYLWGASGLGFAGTREMAQRNPSGKLSLLTFMVMVMIFLAVFLAGVSISVEQAGNIPVFLNLGTFALVLALGIGSYFIEILYLALLPSLPFGIIED